MTFKHNDPTTIHPEDEGLHDVGPELNWQESAVLSWRDPATGLGANHRIAVQQNRGTSVLWCGVYLGENKLYRLNLQKEPFVSLEGVHGIGCGPQRLFHDGKDLRFTLDTPECRVNLVVKDLEGAPELLSPDNALKGVVYSHHFNRHCQVFGDVFMDGKSYKVEGAYGWRDHSWGPRRWDQIAGYRGFHGNFGKDVDFHLLTFITPQGTLDRRGVLNRYGKTYHFDTFTTRLELLEDCYTPIGANGLIILPDGEEIKFSGRAQQGILGNVEEFWGWIGIAEMKLGDLEGGFANFEFTNNPRLGTNPPLISLGGPMVNGLFERKPSRLTERID
jgi:hypothetical protein